MHGTIAIKNRNGRKRKSGRRTSTGALARRTPVDYRAMAAQQPHRRQLPEALRTSEKAASVLGCLNLLGAISNPEYEAGRRYSVIVGAYRAVIGSPGHMQGNGRGYDCIGAQNCPPETCICKSRTDRYMRAYESIPDRIAHILVNQVAVHEELCSPGQIAALRRGLSALARHFGLTNHKKEEHA